MRLSQGQLTLLETCPRKFQQIYLDQLMSPAPMEQWERSVWGSRFHLLMQQRELGLPAPPYDLGEVALQQSIEAFVKTAPEVFQRESTLFRQSEHRRSMELEGHLLTVVYDLLILEADRAEILDWKTYPRPQASRWLRESWQSQLYPFVLAETSDYEPAQITMTYWFVQSAPETPPEKLMLPGDRPQHEQIRQRLTHLLRQLNTWLADYQAGIPFPQVNPDSPLCPSCAFAVRCQRDSMVRSPQLSEVAAIQEVEL